MSTPTKPRIIRKKAVKPHMYWATPRSQAEYVHFTDNTKWLDKQPHQEVIWQLINGFELELRDGLFVAKLCAGEFLVAFLALDRDKQIELNNEYHDLPIDHNTDKWQSFLEGKFGKMVAVCS